MSRKLQPASVKQGLAAAHSAAQGSELFGLAPSVEWGATDV
eukprot:CAMPEP_0195303934 /NCGR_PEP_ID=MMETSP0707-20130614/33558_1 /TAXON_ID=33640 /ORGANISM="Asterionellopsis glacialis, Strain CCMP134" /LENGTH=40 /DNA_ID= /DNA_START= /DNA_END= /DNA_ORIENTATION=